MRILLAFVLVASCATEPAPIAKPRPSPLASTVDTCDPTHTLASCTPSAATSAASSAPTPTTSAPAKPPPSPYPPVSGPTAIHRGNGKSPTANDPASCAACGGDWGPKGMLGIDGCLCKTPDAGKKCHGPLDCEAECLVWDDKRYDGVRCGPQGCNGPRIEGDCSSTYTTFGCWGRVYEMPTAAGPIREVHKVCVD